MVEDLSSHQAILELIYDHLILQRVQGIIWDPPRNTRIKMISETEGDASATLATIKVSYYHPDTIQIITDILGPTIDERTVEVPLADPAALVKIVDTLEQISNEYNRFAVLCEKFGNELIDNLNYTLKFHVHQFRRPIPNEIDLSDLSNEDK